MEEDLPTTKEDPSRITKDRKLLQSSAKLINALKVNPEGFHGVPGLLLLSLLDDASRNAALCSSSALGEAAQGLVRLADCVEVG